VRARALRSVLRELARRNTRGLSSDDELRARFAGVADAASLRFELGEAGVVQLEPQAAGVDGALARLLTRIHEAQATGSWRRLKSCPGPHCGWLFYDGSRNASSKWCSMSICGNRTKTAAYRRRRRLA
jgi:predicted RNA-binding Zn ribbon-like protein